MLSMLLRKPRNILLSAGKNLHVDIELLVEVWDYTTLSILFGEQSYTFAAVIHLFLFIDPRKSVLS